ncbi:MAG: LUD domain-containing protein [Anaerolineaceae bacterium]|nr:LUD domain-containing protein [Anaerolineaceae bacterium]
MTTQIENITVTPNEQYSRLASDTQIQRTAQSLEARGIHTIIAANGEETQTKLLELLPEGAEVFLGSSTTLKELGLNEIVDNSDRFNSVRVRLAKMDRDKQSREMIKMGAVPEYIIGSVQAVTEDGSVVIASNTGSQLAPYAASAAHVIWVVGSQKIVRTLEEGIERVYQYALPLEDARLMKDVGVHSSVNKILIVHREVIPGRVTMVLVKEKLGF